MKRRNLSQGQLAALAGCTQPAISALVTGRAKRPSIELLIGVASALDVSLDALVGGHDKPANVASLEDRVAALERALAHSSQATTPVAESLDTYLGILRKHKPDLVSKGIEHLAIFGSAVRGQLGPDSDIDVLVTFRPEAMPSVFRFVHLSEMLERLLGRKVDLVERDSVLPSLRRRIFEEAVNAF